MLIAFVVRNFRSIHDEQRFSFATSSDPQLATTHCLTTGLKAVRRLSKSAVIFGPNGGGKTNFLMGFAVMRDLVLRSTHFNQNELAERYTPFLLDESAGLPSEFAVEVLIEKIRYRYSFAYDGSRIRRERLLVYAGEKAQRWFDRTAAEAADGESWRPFSASFSGPRAVWRASTRPQALFLTTAAQLNCAQLQPLYRWFETGMALVFASEPANLPRMATWIQDAGRKRSLLDFLRAAGVEVEDVRIAGSDTRPVIEFAHRHDDGSSVWLQSSAVSAGLRRLVSLSGPLLAAIQAGRLLLIDEFDLSLHPLVARYLIEFINNAETSEHSAQLILTSHNTSLMDMGILRRDEMWLMELDEHQASRLVRLWRMPRPPRKGELVGKHYLFGRYGAVPEIKSRR